MREYSDCSKWESLSIKKRCAIVSGVAATISAAADELTRLCGSDQRTDPVETIAAELLPLCSALRFIGRRGAGILKPKRLGILGRPAWLWGVQSEVHRDPHGRVLILGTWNYPLLLVGVQAAQALAAGNEVWIKPAIGSEAVTESMVRAFHDAGVPPSQLRQLDSSTESAVAAIDGGVDLIVLTGAASTGRKVLQAASRMLTPTIMELSGCDAVVVMPGADLTRTASAIHFGLNFNAGATCIGPRRLIVEDAMADGLCDALRARLQSQPPAIVHPTARETVAATVEQAIRDGAIDSLATFDAEQVRATGRIGPVVLDRVQRDDAIAAADLFAPVTSIIRVANIAAAVKIVNQCPYRLAASVFGPLSEASKLAAELRVGSVAINDMLVPTADPRVPFGGRGNSGFGVTRGAEGLLAMTVPRVIGRRRGRFALHLAPRRKSDAQTLIGALQLLHAGSLRERIHGLRRMVSAIRGTDTDNGNTRAADEQNSPHHQGEENA